MQTGMPPTSTGGRALARQPLAAGPGAHPPRYHPAPCMRVAALHSMVPRGGLAAASSGTPRSAPAAAKKSGRAAEPGPALLCFRPRKPRKQAQEPQQQHQQRQQEQEQEHLQQQQPAAGAIMRLASAALAACLLLGSGNAMANAQALTLAQSEPLVSQHFGAQTFNEL
eukprot:365199-Chlamydomonas_euryale.AAC.7